MFLFIIQDLLQAEEILTSLFVKFLIDILIDSDESWNNYMFKGIHSTVGNLDLLV